MLLSGKYDALRKAEKIMAKSEIEAAIDEQAAETVLVMKECKARIADNVLRRRLAGTDAVLVRGPKWCGKTTICVRHAKSVLHMADSDTRVQNLRMTNCISFLLKGENPRLIDKWQEPPGFWDAVRAKVDGEKRCQPVYSDWITMMTEKRKLRETVISGC